LQESLQRCIVFLISAVVLLCWGYAIVGTNVWLDSGRSIMKDLSASTDYVWKTGSCGDLFRDLPEARGNGPHADQAREVCDFARANSIPPLVLKTIIEDHVGKGIKDNGASKGPDSAKAALSETRADLAGRLETLKPQYGLYRKRVAYMWLFIPAFLGVFAVYYYARSNTPVLFASAKGGIERLLFGKSRYSEAWQSFINPKKKP
jgi:hypothetical protein